MLQCRNVVGNMLLITYPLGMLLLWIIFIHFIHHSIAINVKHYTKRNTYHDDDADVNVNANATAGAKAEAGGDENGNVNVNVNSNVSTAAAPAGGDAGAPVTSHHHHADDRKRFMEDVESEDAAIHNTSDAIIENLSTEKEINRNGKNEKNQSITNIITTISTAININLTRQHDGDLFTANSVTSCNADMCIGLSSGTAFWLNDKLSTNVNDPLYRSTVMHDGLMGGSATKGDGGLKYRKDLLKNQRRENIFTKSLMSSSSSSSSLTSPLSSSSSSLSPSLSLPLPLIKDNINDNNNRNNMNGESCQCRCLPYLSTYREDLGICVDDIHECSLSPFVSGSSSEKIPFVFLPLKGQIIYPSREIRFPDILKPVCVVTGAQYLTTNGWTDLRNPIDTNYPFRMFRDEGHTFIQWLGEADLRHKIQGRLIVVHLVCRDMTLSLNASTLPSIGGHPITRNVFSPCIAFRVNGSPINYTNNVSEVSFQSETSSTKATTSDGIMSTKEYIVIGTCTLLLVLIYVSSVFLYLHMKKRKNHGTNGLRNALDDFTNEINYPKNDQVTFGVPFTRSGSLYSAGSLANAITNEPRSRNSLSSLKDDIGIVKNNPLLQHFPQLNENHSGFSSDISNSASECEMDNNNAKCGGASGGGTISSMGGNGIGIGGATNLGANNVYHERKKQMETNVLVHPQISHHHHHQAQQPSHQMHHLKNRLNHQINEENEHLECTSSSTEEKECLPSENVAIIEDIITEEKLENLRAMVNGNIRKKLYFNPSYFEPHLLAEPPPAALEFLQKIREVISIAKYKMSTKRYQPSLIMIPEEGAMAHSNTPSPYSSHLQNVSECHGCVHSSSNIQNNHCSGHLKNCGEKRNSIEKWLQTVHSTEAEPVSATEIQAVTETDVDHGEDAQELQQYTSRTEKSIRTITSNDQIITETDPIYSKRLNNNTTKQNNLLLSTGQKRVSRKELVAPKQKPPLPPLNKINNNNNSKGSNNKDNNSKLRPSSSLTIHPSVVATTPNAMSREPYCQNAPIYEACRMPQMLPQFVPHNNLENLTALTKAATIYGYAETGSEIYNNPKFSLQDSPTTSQRSRESSHKSKQHQCSRKHFELLDATYAAPTVTANATATINATNVVAYGEHQQYYDIAQLFTMENNREKAINNESEYSTTLRSNNSFHLNIPTPDYDSTMEKKNKDIYNNTQSSGPSVPTPDYSSLSRKSLKQYQPDSPIYRRKSPQYLIVDYETDSLERSVERTKEKVSSQSSSSPSSDVSSQLSPSLSTALPMEEELEITHTVFGDRCNSKNLTKSGKKSSATVAKAKTSGTVDANMANKVKIARIKYDTPFQGSMTIEVEHEPPSDLERSTDSDQYEPDTLDRKPKKQSFCDMSNWPIPEELDRRQREREDTNSPIPSNDYIDYDSPTHIPSGSLVQSSHHDHIPIKIETTPLKNLRKTCTEQTISANCKTYQTLLVRQNSDCSCKYAEKGSNNSCLESRGINEKGRILTLEAKHSRRQRPSESNTPPPPDVEISNHGLNRTTIRISTHKGHNLEKNNLSGANCSIDLEIGSEKNSHSQESLTLECTIENKGNYRTHEDDATPTSSPISTPIPTPTPPTKRTNSSALDVRPTNSANTTLSKCSATGKLKRIPPPKYLICSNGEDETLSNHSECTEITGVSETKKNSEIEGTMEKKMSTLSNQAQRNVHHNDHNNDNGDNSLHFEKSMMNKLMNDNYSAIFNTHINGLRSDYSLNKYMIRRKEKLNDNGNENDNDMENDKYNENDIDNIDDGGHESIKQITNSQHGDNSILRSSSSSFDLDFNRVDNMSLSSRSNRSSSRLTQRTKEMYRNAGVPIGIAYPQRNNTNSNGNSNNAMATPTATPTSIRSAPTANVQNVYRCEIEPVQLTHGMQIAMGLKDRPPKKTKDLRNAWKKFVSIAASKFNPTSYDKNSSRLLDVLAKSASEATNANVNANTNTNNHVITPNGTMGQLQQTQPIIVTGDSYLESSSSAPFILANQNYYEQRFGIGARSIPDPDSGYLSADSIEALKRGYYDRYNYRLICNRERIITVDTIEDNSDNEPLTNSEDNSHYNTLENQLCNGAGDYNGITVLEQSNNVLYTYNDKVEEDEREAIEEEEEGIDEAAEKLERIDNETRIYDEISDNDSDKTLIYSNTALATIATAATILTTTTTAAAATIMTTTANHLQTKSIYICDEDDGGDDDDDDDDDDGDGNDDDVDDEPITATTTTPSNISSETDDETNAEDMWESGAESIETHSVLYKNIRKQLQGT